MLLLKTAYMRGPEMAQSAKGLPHKPSDLSLAPQSPCKMSGYSGACLQYQHTEGYARGLAGAGRPARFGRDLVSKNQVKSNRGNIQCTHKHVHTHIHTIICLKISTYTSIPK